MEKGELSNITRRSLLTFMVFAFFYLVVGDLVIIHQRAIFDFDIFTYYPINKSDNTGKKNLSKFKNKNPKIQVSFLKYLSGFLELENNNLYQSETSIDIPSVSEFVIEKHSSLLYLRGPPLLA